MNGNETDEGNEEGKETPVTVTPVEEVTKNYEKLKEANDKVEAELLRKEELKAKVALGGKSDAGQEPKKESEDEKWEKNAKERYEGTGMDPTPDDKETEFI